MQSNPDKQEASGARFSQFPAHADEPGCAWGVSGSPEPKLPLIRVQLYCIVLVLVSSAECLVTPSRWPMAVLCACACVWLHAHSSAAFLDRWLRSVALWRTRCARKRYHCGSSHQGALHARTANNSQTHGEKVPHCSFLANAMGESTGERPQGEEK